MKLAIIFDANQRGGGGFYQSIKTIETLIKFKKSNYELEIITTTPEGQKDIENRGFKSICYNKQRWSNIYYKLKTSKIIELILKKLRIKNPFSEFLNQNKIDFVYFLGPSNLINLCEENNFIVNIYDFNHRMDNYFPEYRVKGVIDEREVLFQNCVNKSFKIIVDTERTKEELKFLYCCKEDKIEVIPFNAYLPSLFEKSGKKVYIDIDHSKFDFIKKQKTFFYPAQFWAHKNHTYIIDAARFLKEKNINFNIIFCGSNKGNLKIIKNKIKESNLESNIKIFDFLKDEEIIYLYQNVSAIVMPTYVARSTLPLYESFYFDKNIFYAKDVLDSKLEELVIPIDLNDPKDLSIKLENFINEPNNNLYIKKIKLSKEYLEKNCHEQVISEKLNKIILKYRYLRKRWS
jgi:glycosyltransferase involved in cell wall biosynthesis